MRKTRQQLSMFVPDPLASEIEAVRRMVDPVQYALIPAHVTLCREDELSDLAAVQTRLEQMQFAPIVLTFGLPERFDGHGLLLPCIQGEPAFHRLRACLLGTREIRNQAPHITLAHPRNPQAVANVPGMTLPLVAGMQIAFNSINLIEQIDHEPWTVLARWTLNGGEGMPLPE